MRSGIGICIALLLAGVIVCPASNAGIVAEYTGSHTGNGVVVSSTWTHAQAFDVVGSPTVSEVQLPLSRWSGSTGWVRVDLCQDAGGEPGNPTGGATVMANTIKKFTQDEWIPFQWTGSTLSTGRWWIVCSVTSSDAEIDWWGAGVNGYGSGADTKTSFDGGSTWPAIQKADNYFKVFGARTSVDTLTYITTTPGVVTATGRSHIEVTVKETPGGNPVGGPGLVNLSATVGTLGKTQVELKDGTASTYWDAPASTGGANITADYLGHVFGGSDYQTSSANAALSVITEDRSTTTTQNLSSSTCDTRQSITCSVTVKDSLNNNVPGGKVTFDCAEGSFSPNPADVSSGQASTTWTADNDTGTFPITANFSGHSSGGVNYGASGDQDNVTVDYTDVSTTTTVSVSPTHPYVGVGKSWVSVTVKDGATKAVPGGTIQLSPPAIGYYDSTTLTLSKGKASTIWHAPAAITGTVNVNATYQQYLNGGNRYATSSGNTSLQCVQDTDSDGGEMKWMLEWVTNYKAWQLAYSDLDNTDDDARGFGHKLRDDFGWTGHDYGNDSAQQDDFKLHSLGGKNNDYLDKHDFTYYSGHGSPDNISFNNLNDAVRLWAFQALDAWGDGDCEWVTFSACQVMKDDDDWADCFNGAHLQMGYTTNMDDSATFGGAFANLLTQESLDDAPHVIAQAFFLAGDQTLDNTHKQRVIGENQAMFDDYIWGQGFVNSDPSDDNSYSWISNDVDVNNAPQADANGPYAGTAGQKIDLDASASWDPDAADVLTYVWDMDTSISTDNGDWDNDGDGSEPDDDKDACGRHAEYTYDTSGAYNIRLIVYDKAWQVATAATSANIAAGSPSDSGPVLLASEEEEEEIEIIDNFDPGSLPTELTLPVFEYVGATLGYNEMMNISDYYVAGDSAHIDNLGNWNMVAGNHTIIANAYTGSVAYVDRTETYRLAHPPLALPDRATCVAIAQGFMNSTGITRDGAVLEGFTDCSVATNEKGGRAVDSRIPFQRCVDYRRQFTVTPTMNTYPAVGPGGKLRVVVNDYGDARGFTKVWRQVTQSPYDIPLVGANQAIQSFHTLVDKALYGTRIVPDCKRIEIDNVSIGYYEDDFLTYQETIYPVYVLHLTCEDDTSSHKTQVYVPAGWAPLQASIDAPSDGAVYNHGDPIMFDASASGGAPPYTYEWESDRDGALGSSASIVVNDLSVSHKSGELTEHVVALKVTDSEDQTAIGYVSVLVNPTTMDQAKQLPDDAPVAFLGEVVTASFDDRFYVEKTDRTSGICIVSSAAPSESCAVIVYGAMDTTADRERCVEATSVEVLLDQAGPIGPLGTTVLSLGGGDWGFPPLGQEGVFGGFGLNNIGLLVRSWGLVTSLGADYFVIDDGSGEYAKCLVPPQVIPPNEEDYVSVTGISSCEDAGGGLYRLIRVRNQDDVRVIAVP